jgi:Zn-dependent metalloprotease
MVKQYVTAVVFLGFMLILRREASVHAQSGQLAYGLEQEAQPRELTTSEKIIAKRLNIQLDGDPAEAAINLVNGNFIGTYFNAKAELVRKDDLGYRHIKIRQYYKGVPIEDAGIVAHVNKKNILYHVDGDFMRTCDMSVNPKIGSEKAGEIALNDARQTKCLDDECIKWGYVDTMLINSDLLAKAQAEAKITSAAQLFIYAGFLIYKIQVTVNVLDNAKWEYWVDANTGEIIKKENLYRSVTPPSASGARTQITGVKLGRETNPASDSVATIYGWRDAGAPRNYFLWHKPVIDSGFMPWRVFNLLNSTDFDTTDTTSGYDWEQRSISNWYRSDTTAVSVARNMQLFQEWVRDTLGIFSINDDGLMLTARIHYGTNENGAWARGNGNIDIGDGDGVGFGSSGVLDIVAHEFGHEINSIYSKLGGLLNESFADIVGIAVEFAKQPSGVSDYPNTINGRNDWLIGEDCIIYKKGERDFRYPQRVEKGGDTGDIQGMATLYDGDNFWTNPDFHCRGGIQDFAFYLLASGNSDSTRHNEGHAYGVFSGISIPGAVRVALRANTALYESSESKIADAKNAWLLAAQDLIDEGKIPSTAIAVVESAWAAVRVLPQLRFRHNSEVKLQVGLFGDLKAKDRIYQSSFPLGGSGDLKFHHSSHASGAAYLDASSGDMRYGNSTSPYQNDSNYLDTSGFLGRLVIRSPNGKAFTAIDSSGLIRIWKQRREYGAN